MSKRIVLFGATGYTGELVARELVACGERPVLAGRRRQPLAKLAEELDSLEIAFADVTRPASVRSLLWPGDVLVTTVGPFNRWGGPAVQAVIEAGGIYLDSTGESGFLSEIFERHGPAAERAAASLVPAFGYDFVPGNLAAALAMQDAGDEADRIDIAYYMGEGAYRPHAMSSGTRATLVGALVEGTYGFRHGRIVQERGARRVRHFDVDGRLRPGVSIGTAEQYTLVRLYPGLREVNSYLGWFGSLSRPMQVVSALNAPVLAIPPVKRAMRALVHRLVQGSRGGPETATLEATESRFVAEVYDIRGQRLAQRHFRGPDGLRFTARLLAKAARTARTEGVEAVGAIGPVEAFGLTAVSTMSEESGLVALEGPAWAAS